ncbi:MAG: TnsA endonuclease N-terminal domain-containing protein [Planctomycetaceae bacterium]|nr:TnsA endonuclease N-terminal domain-containing protein [Planctomycetaceae bacterium]
MTQLNDPAQLSTFRLRRRTPGSFVLVPYPQLGRSLRCQGQLEAATALILSASTLVTNIQEQPCSIWYAWRETARRVEFQLCSEPRRRRRQDGVRLSYIVPDFLVTCRDGSRWLLEVKPSTKLSRPDVRRKLAVATEFAHQQGWTFHVVTEQHLQRGYLLDNLQRLTRYRQVGVDAEIIALLVDAVATGPRTIDQLIDSAVSSTAQRTSLYHLLATGRLSCDLQTAPLNSQTLIFDGGIHPWDPFASLWGPSGCSTDGRTASSDNPAVASSPQST